MCLTANSTRECAGSICQVVGFSTWGAIVAVIGVPPTGPSIVGRPKHALVLPGANAPARAEVDAADRERAGGRQAPFLPVAARPARRLAPWRRARRQPQDALPAPQDTRGVWHRDAPHGLRHPAERRV